MDACTERPDAKILEEPKRAAVQVEDDELAVFPTSS
jgi:hypothetical protein